MAEVKSTVEIVVPVSVAEPPFKEIAGVPVAVEIVAPAALRVEVEVKLNRPVSEYPFRSKVPLLWLMFRRPAEPTATLLASCNVPAALCVMGKSNKIAELIVCVPDVFANVIALPPTVSVPAVKVALP